ncbi:hypothetical protein Psfp_04091 [Pelotomaculum sp. FP]|uniref:hypothetical protein n=1 Tax=Pelotomaculum sp. FP TaxID=261474 RepID=UPI001066570E|nr:hypothetical protein [Pelotomaculum sp. FP]TEB10841.1 hypothetical protein Psfp_04091 [Pelotomaculum sp. FP]
MAKILRIGNKFNQHYKINENYKWKYDLVVGVKYGTEGIIPAVNKLKTSCVSSSGSSLCISYAGHETIEINGVKLYIIYCLGGIKCLL